MVRILGLIISGYTVLFLFGFTIWAGFDWIHTFGTLDFHYWAWALLEMPILILINLAWFLYVLTW